MSGLDTNSIIEQLVSLERMPITRLEGRQETLASQKSLLAQIEATLADLSSMAQGLGSLNEFLAFLPKSSNESAVTVEAGGNAPQGSYSLTVQNLAKGEQDRSVAFTDAYTQVNPGTLTLQLQGEDAVDVTISDGDSLSDVAESINNSGARVTATIINTGTESYLNIYSIDSGHEIGGAADDALIITETYTNPADPRSQLGFTQVVQAENAMIELDGLSIERRSNTLSDVIEGLSFSLLDDTGQPTVQVTVAPDNGTVIERVKEFISAYNQTINLISTQFQTTEGVEPGVLFGDSTLRNLQRGLGSIISDTVAGAGGAFSNLSSIGISTASNGTLSLNETELEEALNLDMPDLAQLFVLEDTGVFARLDALVDRYTNDTDGLFKFRFDGIESRDRDLTDQIDRLEFRLEAYEENLVSQFVYLESVLAQLSAQQGAATNLASIIQANT